MSCVHTSLYTQSCNAARESGVEIQSFCQGAALETHIHILTDTILLSIDRLQIVSSQDKDTSEVVKDRNYRFKPVATQIPQDARSKIAPYPGIKPVPHPVLRVKINLP